MKERPILFSGLMVRRLLAGEKTQTRRVINPQPPDWLATRGESWEVAPGLWGFAVPGRARACRSEDTLRCPYGAPGDLLWVREACYVAPSDFGHPVDANRQDNEGRPRVVGYAATMDSEAKRCAEEYGVRQRPSIHMPRWASRLTLEVAVVRVERLHDIDEADAVAEGIGCWTKDGALYKHGVIEPGSPGAVPWQDMPRTARDAFAVGWDTINGKRAPWASNPWVWVVAFQVAAAGAGP